jgi:hypothetical protein
VSVGREAVHRWAIENSAGGYSAGGRIEEGELSDNGVIEKDFGTFPESFRNIRHSGIRSKTGSSHGSLGQLNASVFNRRVGVGSFIAGDKRAGRPLWANAKTFNVIMSAPGVGGSASSVSFDVGGG